MRNENFYNGFIKQASWIAPVVGALKSVGTYVAKNPLKTLGGVLTAEQLASGAKDGARMAAKGPPKSFSVSPVQY